MGISSELLAEYRGPSATSPAKPDDALDKRVFVLEVKSHKMLKALSEITAALSRRIEVLEDERRRPSEGSEPSPTSG